MHLFVVDEFGPESRALKCVLEQRGARVAVFESTRFPLGHHVAFSPGAMAGPGSIETNEGRFCLSDVETVFWRSPDRWATPPCDTKLEEKFAIAEARTAIAGLSMCLAERGAFWVNPETSASVVQLKVSQLRLAMEVGLDVPRTLLSNDLREVERFWLSCGGQVIRRAIVERSGPSIEVLRALPTESPGGRPLLLQERIEQSTRTVLIMIGYRSFPFILTERDGAQAWSRLRTVPRAIESSCVALAQRVGLPFCAIEMIERDGRHLFQGLYSDYPVLEIEAQTHVALLDELACMLIRGTPDFVRGAERPLSVPDRHSGNRRDPDDVAA